MEYVILMSGCSHQGIIEKLQNININNGYCEMTPFFWDKNNGYVF